MTYFAFPEDPKNSPDGYTWEKLKELDYFMFGFLRGVEYACDMLDPEGEESHAEVFAEDFMFDLPTKTAQKMAKEMYLAVCEDISQHLDAEIRTLGTYAIDQAAEDAWEADNADKVHDRQCTVCGEVFHSAKEFREHKLTSPKCEYSGAHIMLKHKKEGGE